MADSTSPIMSGAKGSAEAIKARQDGESGPSREQHEPEVEEQVSGQPAATTTAATATATTTTTTTDATITTSQAVESTESAGPAEAPEVIQIPEPPPVPATTSETKEPQTHEDAHASGGGIAVVDDSVVCNITLLLPTGARHPYRIDEKYLTKRNVEIPGQTDSGKKDPFSISVYKLKELILREWREEWEGKPASPSSIRLIHFGKLLDDKEQLKKYQFSTDAPNVVHMSVRPAEMLEEEEAAKGKSGGRESRSREGGSGCCVIL